MSLTQLIINKIQSKGAISFREFMEMSLYYPEFGYYMTPQEKIGKNGDYYTSPNMTPVFGEMIAKQIEKMKNLLGEKDFTIVEMGAGIGLFAYDILEYFKNENINYCIIEKSKEMRKKQKNLLCEKVKWFDSILELKGFSGCVISNELVDAFPVHIVVMEKELMEVFIDYNGDFFEILKPASSELKNYFEELGVIIQEDYRTEVNLDAIKWITEVALCLKKGFVITIDYGYLSSELYQEYRNFGTLMCYYKHTTNTSPYINIGKQDITSHVNFSALSHFGNKNGLEVCSFTDQAHFLLDSGIEDYLAKLQKTEPENYLKKMLQIKSLMIGMGETFKVLIQKKN